MSSLSDYVIGLGELGLLFAALGLGAYRLRGRLLPGWSGASARLAEIVIALGTLILTLEMIGVVGLYKPGVVLFGGIVVGLAMAVLAGPERDGPRLPAPEVPLVLIAIAALAATAVAAHWAFPTQAGMDIGMYLPNSTWHNMPFATRFVQEEQVGALLFTEPLKLSVWFYPQNSELLHSAGILFMGNDFLSPLLNMGWIAGCLLAAWCIGRPYAVGAASVVGLALILDANMLLLYQPGDAKNDIMGLFCLLAAAALLINAEAAQRREGRGPGAATGESHASNLQAKEVLSQSKPGTVPGHLPTTTRFGSGALVIAALAAGIALGTKINLLAPVAALTIGVIAISIAGERVKTALLWGGGLLLGGGFWFIRNMLESSGNPLPWIQAGPLPGPDQLDLYVRDSHSVAEYLFNWTVISDWFFPGLENDFGTLWPVVFAIVIGAIVMLAVKAETPTQRMLAVVAGFAAIAYVFTPLTAAGEDGAPTGFERNVRYLAPALALGLTLLPLFPALRAGRRPLIVLGVFTLLFLESIVTSNQWEHPGYRQGAIALAILLILVPVGATVAWQRNWPRWAIAAGVLIALAGGTVYGRERENDYLSGRYQALTVPDQIPNGIPEAMGAANELTDQRIALGGTTAGFKQYLFYGRDLSNYVQYIGQQGPNGQFLPVTDCAEFLRALDDGDYGYVIIAPPHTDLNGRPPEVAWVEPDPNSQLVESFFNVSVYKLNGPLDPAGCEALSPDQRTEDPLGGEES